MSDLPHAILVVFGLLWLVKAIWCIAAPDSFRRLAQRWMNLVTQAGALLGALALVVSLTLLGAILLYRPRAEWLVIGLGMFYFVLSLMLFKHHQYRRVLESLIVQKSRVKTRLVGILLLLGAGFAIWIAWEDM